jgi:hypothetical protein
VSLAAALALALSLAPGSSAVETPGATPPQPKSGIRNLESGIRNLESGIRNLESKPIEPIERRPYRIEAHVAAEPEARIDAQGREQLLAAWSALIQQFVGAPWKLKVATAGSRLSTWPFELLEPETFRDSGAEVDKVWVLRISRQGAGLSLAGREFDSATRRLGPVHERLAPFVHDVPRSLLELALELFAPSAVVGEESGGGVSLTVQGAALEAASPTGRVVAVGSVFVPIRFITQPDGKVTMQNVPLSFLRVEALNGPVARCAIISAIKNPLARGMIVQKFRTVALGVKPGKAPLKFRFVTKPNRAPAAGYVLTARDVPDGLPREVGTTDREGRITLPPGFAEGLVILRLLAGNVEPMVELPAMAGESSTERTIPIEPKPLTVALETRLNSLRDEVIDLVAVRARLEARLKARFDGDDRAGAEETLQEFAQLPSQKKYAARLTELKEEAARQQAKLKTAVLTRTAQAQLGDLQSLIDRYLDDEIFQAYIETLERLKTESVKEKSQAEAKAKAKARARGLAAAKGSVPQPRPQRSPAPAASRAALPKAPTAPSRKAAPKVVPF